ncbi:DUF3048 domain-containing protein [Alkalihalophilus lindianensis]|uniref:DUF3048 domain-containing protein n=1 Tax=Alkalihalophilus lindianensis TaxID=1630542 RepID=A0ABU3XCS5_9BACI|nr:DUF3048 domain-containing protein [Alkalihalophilus lindianensis]MDV2685684.1 DUF3048 domain-containing protein [Alkalihalophilus lindianensis]
MKRWITVAFIASILLVGCNNEADEISEAIESTPNTLDDENTEEEQPFTYPLTGDKSDVELDHRPVGVMINNHPAARPQSGLVDADVVYEVLAEGEMTRFLALFHSTFPKVVGPVRSARDYYIDLANGYDAVFITHGWSPGAEARLKAGEADYLSGLHYDGTLFQRSTDRRAPHNSYITFENIQKGIEEQGYDWKKEVSPLSFYTSEDIQVVGHAASTIVINYLNRNEVSYQFDEQTGKYYRFNGDSQTVDYHTNEPLLVANLFIVETEHNVLDEAGRRDINLTSGGRGHLVQSGIANEVNWKNIDGRILPVDENGNEMPLKPGMTWINVVPTSPSMDKSVSYN